MKLSALHIHSFRGVLDASIALRGYSLLVGPNAGKSTVIDAIRAFYEKDGFKFSKGKDFPYKDAPDDESWIELEFSLSDDKCPSANDTPTSRLRPPACPLPILLTADG